MVHTLYDRKHFAFVGYRQLNGVMIGLPSLFSLKVALFCTITLECDFFLIYYFGQIEDQNQKLPFDFVHYNGSYSTCQKQIRSFFFFLPTNKYVHSNFTISEQGNDHYVGL